MLGLPSGQDVAEAMADQEPADARTEIATGPDGAVAKQHGLHTQTPLWYYILKEAEVRKDGERLGPVGARIVAEVFVGLVHGDHRARTSGSARLEADPAGRRRPARSR